MIPFASQRGGGQDLATHLLNEYDNEIARVEHIRGAIADDLHGAFKEWGAQAEALTRCDKYLYSLSINPDPAQGAAHPRAIHGLHRADQAGPWFDRSHARSFSTPNMVGSIATWFGRASTPSSKMPCTWPLTATSSCG